MAKTPKDKQFKTDELLKSIDNALLISTYEEYEDAIKKFADGHFNFLVVIGRGGIGKSQSSKQMPEAITISGKATGWGIFSTIADEMENGNTSPTLVISDLPPKAFSDSETQALLKDLTEKHNERTIQWNTAAATNAGYRREYVTGARVLLLANSFVMNDEHALAIMDRTSMVIVFDPSPYEVHKRAAEWFGDFAFAKAKQLKKKIDTDQINRLFQFMYDHLRANPRNSHRKYQTLIELYFAYPDKWESKMLAMIYGNDERVAFAAELLADHSIKSDRQRGVKFAKRFCREDEQQETYVRQFYRLRDSLGFRNEPIGPPVEPPISDHAIGVQKIIAKYPWLEGTE